MEFSCPLGEGLLGVCPCVYTGLSCRTSPRPSSYDYTFVSTLGGGSGGRICEGIPFVLFNTGGMMSLPF